MKMSSCKIPVIIFGFELTFNFLYRFSKKNFKYEVNENPSSGSRVVPCGRTGENDEANSRFSQFCERAQKGSLD